MRTLARIRKEVFHVWCTGIRERLCYSCILFWYASCLNSGGLHFWHGSWIRFETTYSGVDITKCELQYSSFSRVTIVFSSKKAWNACCAIQICGTRRWRSYRGVYSSLSEILFDETVFELRLASQHWVEQELFNVRWNGVELERHAEKRNCVILRRRT